MQRTRVCRAEAESEHADAVKSESARARIPRRGSEARAISRRAEIEAERPIYRRPRNKGDNGADLKVRPYVCDGIGRSWMIIQLMPKRSRSCANRVAKNVSCIGMNTSPPLASAEKMRSASASLSTLSDK